MRCEGCGALSSSCGLALCCSRSERVSGRSLCEGVTVRCTWWRWRRWRRWWRRTVGAWSSPQFWV